MKKLAFLFIMVFMIVTFSGCKQGNVSIKASKIEANTMLIKSDGTVQVATVEDFTQSYYDADGLKAFITENLSKFNEEVNDETAIVLDSLETKDGKAVMVLEYASMEYYEDFNEVDAKFYTSVTDNELGELPDTLDGVGDEASISKEELLSLENPKVVVLNEEYNLIVSGKIKYYSNGTMVNKKEITTSPSGTVVVY